MKCVNKMSNQASITTANVIFCPREVGLSLMGNKIINAKKGIDAKYTIARAIKVASEIMETVNIVNVPYKQVAGSPSEPIFWITVPFPRINANPLTHSSVS